MNRIRKRELTITLISLSSILESCLMNLTCEVKAWLGKRKRLAAELKYFREESPDQTELDRRNEIWHHWEGRTVAHELLLELYVAVAKNPFPGEQKRLFEVACEVFPDAAGSFAPGQGFRGRAYWKEVFLQFPELDGNVRVYFPVETEKIDVFALERKLIELSAGGEFVLLRESRQVLPWKVRSKAYKYVKGVLQERGWKWGQKKLKGQNVKVIWVPV